MNLNFVKWFSISFGWRNSAGLISLAIKRVCIHLIVDKDLRLWGFDNNAQTSLYVKSFGIGPFLLICKPV